MQIIPNRKIWFIFSGTLVTLSLVALLVWGLKPGIDFTGGSLLELQFASTPPAPTELISVFQSLHMESPEIQLSGAHNLVVRFAPVTEGQHQELIAKVKEKYHEAQEVRFDSIGPAVGHELFQKALIAIVLVTIMILLYIAWSFRKIPKRYSSWKFGLVVIITLLHDVLITAGIFVIVRDRKSVV